MNNQLRRITDRTEEKWIRDRCSEIDDHLERDVKFAYKHFRQLPGKTKSRKFTHAILNKDWQLETDLENIKKR